MHLLSRMNAALVRDMNLTFTDKVSGILGLGFSRLSSIERSTTNATSFLGSLAQDGVLSYPIFGLSLSDFNNGSFTLGMTPASTEFIVY
jgi:Eukaryotic aspartyl protease